MCCEVMLLSCCRGVVFSYSNMRNETCVLSGFYHELVSHSLPGRFSTDLNKRRENNSAENFHAYQHFDSGT